LDNRRALLFIFGLWACSAQAAAVLEVPLLDPWVPPALRKQRIAGPPSSGATLRAQVEGKLRTAFEAAARPHGGTLTRDAARDAGLGFIANHFDAIDRGASGRVRFEDYKRFLQERGALLE
jgi:hypothetical protein